MDKCENCDEPMHRFGFPRDADGHQPTVTACINTLRGNLDDALGFIEARWVLGDEGAGYFMRRRAASGQRVREVR